MWKKVAVFSLIIGTLLACTKEIEPEAIAYYKKAMKLDEKSSYSNRDSILFYLNKAIEIDSNYAEPYFQLGCIYTLEKDYHHKAFKCLNKALEIDPKHAGAHYWIGYIYQELFKDKEIAIEHLILSAQFGNKDAQESCDRLDLKWRDE